METDTKTIVLKKGETIKIFSQDGYTTTLDQNSKLHVHTGKTRMKRIIDRLVACGWEKANVNNQAGSICKLIEFITEPEIKNVSRKCSDCGKEMSRGYYFEETGEYYCSDECMHEHYSEEEYNAVYDDDKAYWTEWED